MNSKWSTSMVHCKNIMFEALAGQYFDRAFRKMVAAFETRAEELYGKRSSSAQSVA